MNCLLKSAGREPRLWFDKYCIDQTRIEDSLACLPVCLAGCTKLIILCGETYLSRLWCLIEIFVFLEMGGDLANLEVYLLGEEAPLHTSGEHATGLSAQISQFDCRSAKSSSDEDTFRLHQALHAAGFEKINNMVRSVFGIKLPT